jgi:hypothetical protein
MGMTRLVELFGSPSATQAAFWTALTMGIERIVNLLDREQGVASSLIGCACIPALGAAVLIRVLDVASPIFYLDRWQR